MDTRVAPLRTTLTLNTRLFLNCLDGITDDQAVRRPSATTNSLAFIAAHVCDSRYYLLRFLAVDAPSPFPELETARSIDEVSSLPELADIQSAWRMASARLEERLLEVGSDFLDTPSPTRFPVVDATRLGAIAFLVQHDSYHIGQLALLRKFCGLAAMSYR